MDGCERFPANVGTSRTVDNDCVVFAYASCLTRRIYIPEADVVGIIHGVPRLVGLSRKNTSKTLKEQVAVVG